MPAARLGGAGGAAHRCRCCQHRGASVRLSVQRAGAAAECLGTPWVCGCARLQAPRAPHPMPHSATLPQIEGSHPAPPPPPLTPMASQAASGRRATRAAVRGRRWQSGRGGAAASLSSPRSGRLDEVQESTAACSGQDGLLEKEELHLPHTVEVRSARVGAAAPAAPLPIRRRQTARSHGNMHKHL